MYPPEAHRGDTRGNRLPAIVAHRRNDIQIRPPYRATRIIEEEEYEIMTMMRRIRGCDGDVMIM
jgi:hypothetical protein